MSTLFVSPHLDDAVLSCGGLISFKNNLEKDGTKVASIFAGLPLPETLSISAEEFHKDCGLGKDAMEVRRKEDLNAAEVLGFEPLHLDLLECLYRKDGQGKHLYSNTEEIFTNVIRESEVFLSTVEDMVEKYLDLESFTEIYVPIALGNHVDHYITRQVFEQIAQKRNVERRIIYYEDMPYAFILGSHNLQMSGSDYSNYLYKLRVEDFNNKVKAINSYLSQVRMLWKNKSDIVNNYQKFSFLISKKKEGYYERYWKKKY